MTTTPDYGEILREIHGGQSPYADLDQGIGASTPDGWGQSSPIFEQLIQNGRPNFIIEVGTWKGASAIHMANLAAGLGLACPILCVDTWLGSAIHWRQPEYRAELGLRNGFPTIYYEFLENVQTAGHTERILPLPLPSDVAFRWLADIGWRADLIYIDADHEALSVYTDITDYWQLLSPDGVLFGDDYLGNWPGVVQAVQSFGKKIGHAPKIFNEKWLFEKSGT